MFISGHALDQYGRTMSDNGLLDAGVQRHLRCYNLELVHSPKAYVLKDLATNGWCRWEVVKTLGQWFSICGSQPL